jgi:hypothetical protein
MRPIIKYIFPKGIIAPILYLYIQRRNKNNFNQSKQDPVDEEISINKNPKKRRIKRMIWESMLILKK